MRKRLLIVIMSLLWCLTVSVLPSSAATMDIDLNDFFPEGIVTVAPDGSEAFLEMDSEYGYTLFLNDPLWGDSGIILPAGSLTLSFGYEFFESFGNDTGFSASLFDGISGDPIDGFSLNSTESGTKIYDLTALLSPGQNFLGLNFSLDEYAVDPATGLHNIGSTAFIKDLRLTYETTVIPEPNTLVLLGIGLIALGGVTRKKGR